MAALPSKATATVWSAARSAPNRALMTPVARYSWNVSAGIRRKVQQERHRGVQAAEEGQEAGERETRIVTPPQRHVGEPRGEQDEAEGSALCRCAGS